MNKFTFSTTVRFIVGVLVLQAIRFGLPSPTLASDSSYVNFLKSDLRSVTPDEAESGTMPIMLTWSALVGKGAHAELQTYVGGQWHLIQNVDAVGQLHHTVPHTLSFIPPVFRLAVVDADGRILARRVLFIPYRQPDSPVTIEEFTLSQSSLPMAQMQGDEGVSMGVTWHIANRPVNTNIVFEQVSATGQVVSAEYSRNSLWLPAKGTGSLHTQWLGDDKVMMRLSVVDQSTRQTYAQQVIELPVVGTESGTDNTGTAAQPEILTFTASTLESAPKTPITLSWTTQDVTEVWIMELLFVPSPGGSGSLQVTRTFDHLPANGSIDITLPDTTEMSVMYELSITEPPKLLPENIETLMVVVNAPAPIPAQVVFQPFENGYMVWRSDTGEVLILYGASGGPVSIYPRDVIAGLPDNPNTEAPEGYFSPQNAFGRVWYAENESLGWALSTETSHQTNIEISGCCGVHIPLPDGRLVLILHSFWNF